MARKLKVFQAQFGFYDSVVAAPSQAAALRAWGTHQNLFASGEAGETTDEAAVAAALAHPETPLRRPLGSKDPFELEPKNLPKAPDAPKRAPAKAAAKAKPVPKAEPEPPPKPKADRSVLDAAEAALSKLDQARKREEAQLAERKAELDRRQAQLAKEQGKAQDAYVTARKAATSAVVAARKAYRLAGGRD